MVSIDVPSPGAGNSLQEALRWSAPSAITLLALVCGLSAVRFASESQFSWSVMCLVASTVLDALDGHVARALNAVTQLGFELDSLCDLANFGVAPALIVYFWGKSLPQDDCGWSGDCSAEHSVLWVSCSVYAACASLRLARFNVAGHAEQMDAELRSPKAASQIHVKNLYLRNLFQRKLYFQGIPAPMGALYALTPMLLSFTNLSSRIGAVGDIGAWAIGRRGTSFTLFATGLLMVSTLPTLSSKMLKTDRQDSHLRSRHWASSLMKAVGAITFVALCVSVPFDTLLVLLSLHFASIPVGMCTYRWATDPVKRQAAEKAS